MAGRPLRGMDRDQDRSIHDAVGRKRPVSRRFVLHVACTCILVTLSVACNRASGRGPEVTAGTTTAASESPQMGPVVLPDLSATADAVRRQIQDAYGVTTKLQESSAPRADLAAAYGRLGMLLMAAEMVDSAEQCFLNSAVLVPNDIRWPYYLGHLYRRKGDLSRGDR